MFLPWPQGFYLFYFLSIFLIIVATTGRWRFLKDLKKYIDTIRSGAYYVICDGQLDPLLG